MKVLVVGATGKFAGLVVPELKKRGAVVRALMRNEDKVEDARKNGADEIAVGDLSDEASLRKAAEGVDGIFHLNPAFAPNEADLGIAMVHAAMAAGVRKFTFSGVIHPSISRMKNHAGKQPVEEALYESGMIFTVLQPAMFMQTLASSWKGIVEHGSFSLPYSRHAKASYVDFRDVAESAGIALTTSKLDYGTFELCSAGMLDRVALTQIVSEVLGRPIQAGELEFDEWAKRAQIPQGPMLDGFRKMYADYDQFGFPGGNALVLRAILNREPRTFRSFISELAGSKT
jgi:uncharacterized protein YbjT (DUF2867 family)